MNRNFEGKTLTNELLKNVNGGNWCPPGTVDESGIRPYIIPSADGINEKVVYIGVNVPHESLGACLNRG